MSGDTLFYIAYPVLGYRLYIAERSFKSAKGKEGEGV